MPPIKFNLFDRVFIMKDCELSDNKRAFYITGISFAPLRVENNKVVREIQYELCQHTSLDEPIFDEPFPNIEYALQHEIFSEEGYNLANQLSDLKSQLSKMPDPKIITKYQANLLIDNYLVSHRFGCYRVDENGRWWEHKIYLVRIDDTYYRVVFYNQPNMEAGMREITHEQVQRLEW